MKILEDWELIEGFEGFIKESAKLLFKSADADLNDLVQLAIANAAWCEGRRQLAIRFEKMIEDAVKEQPSTKEEEVK